jgi:Na+/melibiose symporter-like transporter
MMTNPNTGAIRLVLGFLLMFGAVGGMEHQPDYLLAQITIAALGAALCLWAVRDINRRTNETIQYLKGPK